MRFEFFDGMRSIGSVVWEGPGQIRIEVQESKARKRLTEYFAGESVYLTGTFEGEGDDGFHVRRRDWTPWEFRRACLEAASVHSYTAIARPVGPVEDRDWNGEAWEHRETSA